MQASQQKLESEAELKELEKTQIDWQAKFLELSVPNKDINKDYERTVQQRKLAVRFAEFATRLAIIILKELPLPTSEKTIKPTTLSGVAGGEKFVSCGIFFKLSHDWKNLYGGDCYAIKAASHELNGAMAYLDCRILGLNLPLLALIKYRGHAVLAQTLLPIGKDTIRYGSCDQLYTIHTDILELNSKMEHAAKIINIKGHEVQARANGEFHTVHAPADVEVHEGTDGRFYIIDTARVFPPAAVRKGVPAAKGAHLYQLLRPELIKLNPVPLSSDAFSKWGASSQDQKIHNSEVKEATERLETVIIPAFAAYLDREKWQSDTNQEHLQDDSVEKVDISDNFLIQNNWKQSQLLFPSSDSTPDSIVTTPPTFELVQIVSDMHLHGINTRYLGYLYTLLKKNEEMKVLVLTEAVARVLKHEMEEKWRKIKSLNDDDYTLALKDYINFVFGDSYEANQYWTGSIRKLLIMRFSPYRQSQEHSETTITKHKPQEKVRLFQDSDPINKFTDYLTLQMNLNKTDKAELIVKFRNTVGTLCSTVGLLKVLVSSKYWKLKQFYEDEGNNELLKAMIENLIGEETTDAKPIVTTTENPKPTNQLGHEKFLIKNHISVDLCYNRLMVLLQVQTSQNRDDPSQSFSNDMYNAASIYDRDDLSITTGYFFQPLNIMNIKKIHPSVKHIHKISFEEGYALNRLALAKSGKESKSIFKMARTKFEECLDIKENDHIALYCLAFSLTQLAVLSKDHKRDELWSLSFEKYSRALVLQPRDYFAMTEWARALYICAQLTEDINEKLKLLEKSTQKFEQAAMINPNNYKVCFNAGNAYALYSKCLLKADDQVEKLLNIAIKYYELACDIEPESVQALLNLALSLGRKAVATIDKVEQDTHFERSYVFFKRVVKIKDSMKIRMIWGHYLFRHAQLTNNTKKSEMMFYTAAQKFHRICTSVKISNEELRQEEKKIYSKEFSIWLQSLLSLGKILEICLKVTSEMSQDSISAREKVVFTFAEFFLKLIKSTFIENFIDIPTELANVVRQFVINKNNRFTSLALSLFQLPGSNFSNSRSQETYVENQGLEKFPLGGKIRKKSSLSDIPVMNKNINRLSSSNPFGKSSSVGNLVSEEDSNYMEKTWVDSGGYWERKRRSNMLQQQQSISNEKNISPTPNINKKNSKKSLFSLEHDQIPKEPPKDGKTKKVAFRGRKTASLNSMPFDQITTNTTTTFNIKDTPSTSNRTLVKKLSDSFLSKKLKTPNEKERIKSDKKVEKKPPKKPILLGTQRRVVNSEVKIHFSHDGALVEPNNFRLSGLIKKSSVEVEFLGEYIVGDITMNCVIRLSNLKKKSPQPTVKVVEHCFLVKCLYIFQDEYLLYQISEYKQSVGLLDYFLDVKGYRPILNVPPVIKIDIIADLEKKEILNKNTEDNVIATHTNSGFDGASRSSIFKMSGMASEKSKGGDSGDSGDDLIGETSPSTSSAESPRRRLMRAPSIEANVGREDDGHHLDYFMTDSLKLRRTSFPPKTLKPTAWVKRSSTLQDVPFNNKKFFEESTDQQEEEEDAKDIKREESSDLIQKKKKSIFFKIMDEIFPVEEKLKFYFVEMAFLLEYLEESNTIIREFDPKSILLTKSGHICWDVLFWNSNQNNDVQYLFENTDKLFLAPELLQTDSPRSNESNSSSKKNSPRSYDPKSLWWSISVFFFYCFYGKYPVQIVKKIELEKEVIISTFTKWPTTMSANCRDFFSKMFESSKKDRFCSIQQLKGHIFFETIDWQTMYTSIKSSLIDVNLGPTVPSDEHMSEYMESFQIAQDHISTAMSLSYAEISQDFFEIGATPDSY